MPGDGDFCEWRESSGLWILSLSVTSPSLYFNPCRSGRSQQGWGSGDSGDTSPLSVGRASEVSCKLRASRYGSAKGEDLGNGKWTGAEIWCRKKCKSYWERKACRWPFLEKERLGGSKVGGCINTGPPSCSADAFWSGCQGKDQVCTAVRDTLPFFVFRNTRLQYHAVLCSGTRPQHGTALQFA